MIKRGLVSRNCIKSWMISTKKEGKKSQNPRRIMMKPPKKGRPVLKKRNSCFFMVNSSIRYTTMHQTMQVCNKLVLRIILRRPSSWFALSTQKEVFILRMGKGKKSVKRFNKISQAITIIIYKGSKILEKWLKMTGSIRFCSLSTLILSYKKRSITWWLKIWCYYWWTWCFC